VHALGPWYHLAPVAAQSGSVLRPLAIVTPSMEEALALREHSVSDSCDQPRTIAARAGQPAGSVPAITPDRWKASPAVTVTGPDTTSSGLPRPWEHPNSQILNSVSTGKQILA
jgi:hypothetical protein